MRALFLALGALLLPSPCLAEAVSTIPIPSSPTTGQIEAIDLARLQPIARRALREAIAHRYWYMVPSGGIDAIADYGGEYAAQVLALAVRYKVNAMQTLAREVLASSGGGVQSEAAIRADERRRVLEEVVARIGEVRR